MKVAWIGMGQIGHPMALRVLAGGHELVGHTRRPGDYADVAEAGGRLTSDVREAVAGAEVVCVNLFSEEQLRQVLLSDGGLAAMAPGAVLAMHTTMSPKGMRALADARSEVAMIDAAFSGTAQDAANGRIALMVGGEAAALHRAEPVLSTYADYIAPVGALGSGMTIKLLNNMLFAAQMGLAYDALTAAQVSGIALDDAVKVIARSSGGSFATGLFAGASDLDGVMRGISRYVEKDVAVARQAAGDVGLGGLRAATERFVSTDVSSG
jgi:3-hydroxyisobutyrate dehydrogenase-like beta-hydroxyacid dehydrogenase